MKIENVHIAKLYKNIKIFKSFQFWNLWENAYLGQSLLPPIHLWVNYLLAEVGEDHGDFFMVEVESYDIFNTTFAQILVDIGISKGDPIVIKLDEPKGSWIQPLDYEGIIFTPI